MNVPSRSVFSLWPVCDGDIPALVGVTALLENNSFCSICLGYKDGPWLMCPTVCEVLAF